MKHVATCIYVMGDCFKTAYVVNRAYKVRKSPQILTWSIVKFTCERVRVRVERIHVN